MIKIAQEKQWTLIAAAHAVAKPLGAACSALGLLTLAGYFGSVEALYRPFPGGPATHPLTALCVIFLGLSVCANRSPNRSPWTGRFLSGVILWIAGSRLLEILNGADLTSYLTPFKDVVMRDLQSGKSNSFGTNSAILMLSIGVALIFQSGRMPRLSQVLSSIGMAFPTVSFVGYAYGLHDFFGQMSMLTATYGFVLGAAALALTADEWGVRAMLSPYLGGKIARIQILVGVLVPLLLGYLLVRSFNAADGNSHSLFGSFVVTICWFIVLMVCFSAIYHEKTDFARRQSEAKLANAAHIDPLTGLPNRRKFFNYSEREIERIRRSNGELWVLMLDLDRFKNINDTAGHAVGDRVLKVVAELIERSIRKVDMAGRMGGEEFAILLTDTTRDGCQRVAASIRQGVAASCVPGWTEAHGPITASIGCARLGAKDNLETALMTADQALYRAKDGGRNRVVFADSVGEVGWGQW